MAKPEAPAQPPLSTRPPVTVAGYVRPAARDVAGLIRAHHEGDEDSAAASVMPPVEPLFASEGIFRKTGADRRRRRVPLLGWAAGIAGLAILAAVVGRTGAAPQPNVVVASGSPSTPPIAAARSGSELFLGASAEASSTIGSGAIADGSPSAGASPSPSSGATPSASTSATSPPESPIAKPTPTLPPLKATIKCNPTTGTPPLTVNCTWTTYTGTATPTWYLNGAAYGGHKATQSFSLTEDSSIQLKVVRSGKTVWSSVVLYP